MDGSMWNAAGYDLDKTIAIITLISAPCSSSTVTAGKLELAAAQWRGVRPRVKVVLGGSPCRSLATTLSILYIYILH